MKPLQAKLLTGRSGYDIVVPSLDFTARQIKAQLYLKLDKSKLPNWSNLDPAILKSMQKADPNNDYLVPYMWGTTAFGMNVDAVKKALGNEPLPADMWELLLNPHYTNLLKGCGISFIDAGSEVYPMVNIYLGKDINDTSEAALTAANAVLKKVRKDIRVFNSSPIDLLANGDVCVAMSYSGDAMIARDRAKDAKNGINIDYIIPAKGTEMWIDVMAIPRDAANPDNALAWLNYLMKPEVTAAISNKINYANANLKATPLLNKKLTSDPRIYLKPEVMARLQAKKPLGADEQRIMTTHFNQFKVDKGI
jgi:putrescine transport system substrate-binding protein